MSSYAIPYVTTRTNQGERTVDIYSRLLADRVIYLGTGIDDGVANAIIAQLIHLESENPEQSINLYINSAGGSIPATLAIYDAMQYIRAASRPPAWVRPLRPRRCCSPAARPAGGRSSLTAAW